MYAGQDHDGDAFVDGDDERGGEVRADVEGARPLVSGARNAGGTQTGGAGPGVLDVGEAFGAQQLLGHVLWRHADTGHETDAQPRRLGRRLGGDAGWRHAHETHRPRECCATEELASVHALSSFFSSLRNRQSVPWAISFCGVDLTIPASCSRTAWKRTVSSGS